MASGVRETKFSTVVTALRLPYEYVCLHAYILLVDLKWSYRNLPITKIYKDFTTIIYQELCFLKL